MAFNSYKKIFVLVATLGILLLIIVSFAYFANGVALKGMAYEKAIVRVGNTSFQVDISDTTAKRTLGLSGRESLGIGEGMYFLFSSPHSLSFWMKDMNFSIDIIWINGKEIIGIVEGAVPEPNKSLFQLTSYRSPSPADTVLEVNAGVVASTGMQVGDTVRFERKQ